MRQGYSGCGQTLRALNYTRRSTCLFALDKKMRCKSTWTAVRRLRPHVAHGFGLVRSGMSGDDVRRAVCASVAQRAGEHVDAVAGAGGNGNLIRQAPWIGARSGCDHVETRVI